MIFGLTLTAVYIGFHNWTSERLYVFGVMLSLFVANSLLQATPCYIQESYRWLRNGFYFVVIVICLGLAALGRFVLATDLEIELFYTQLWLSFIYLGVGFGFYLSKFPESHFEYTFVQLYLQSHTLWHIFVNLNGYTLFWLCFNFCMHVEQFSETDEPGILEIRSHFK